MTNEQLLEKACGAAAFSYSPYSHFRVGAALLCSDGSVFTGCNVENASYGGTICAERTAMVKAISEGHRDFVKIAIVCPDADDFGMPCGICRQFMCEYNYDLELVIGKANGEYKVWTLRQLLPEAFTPDSL